MQNDQYNTGLHLTNQAIKVFKHVYCNVYQNKIIQTAFNQINKFQEMIKFILIIDPINKRLLKKCNKEILLINHCKFFGIESVSSLINFFFERKNKVLKNYKESAHNQNNYYLSQKKQKKLTKKKINLHNLKKIIPTIIQPLEQILNNCCPSHQFY
ncbi:hypothetical protein ABPG74_015442 [Tetrahymena malaccensis]